MGTDLNYDILDHDSDPRNHMMRFGKKRYIKKVESVLLTGGIQIFSA
jgi:hypothetical protein